MDIIWDKIARHITQATGSRFSVSEIQPQSGGSINDSYRVADQGSQYFVKRNAKRFADMFAAEYEGLIEIATSDTVRVPQPVCFGEAGDVSYIVLEFLPLTGRNRTRGMAALAQNLAAMHRTTTARFGWHRNNTIGSTPQINTPCDEWTQFWCQHRLGFQLDLLRRAGYAHAIDDSVEYLMSNIKLLFQNYRPTASLVHGDLWSGNYGLTESVPVIFDPAVYYGDRETDLAMTELFGGFGEVFYGAYQEAYPLDEGYRIRKLLYNLYHIMNHVNLFGASYLGQAKGMAQKLISEIK